MSILQFPRVYFNGKIAWDPVTTNNYPVGQAPASYDEDDCESVLNSTPVTASDVAGFRKAAVDDIVSAGNWNPHGSYRSPFFETKVSGADWGEGLNTKDPLVGAPVSFTGMLVDAEPYGAFSSQLYFDDISFGIRGGCRIYGKRAVHFTDRFINFAANPLNSMIAGVAAVMWQTCFPKDAGLQIDEFDSEVLKVLKDSMDDDVVLGVMVRFVTFRTVYYDDPELSNGSAASTAAGRQLQAEIAAGGFQPNLARSNLVGTVGLWSKDDCPSESSDRALLTTGIPIEVSTASGVGKAQCGTAFAYVHENALSLDFSNCIPWNQRHATGKADLGDLTIWAHDPTGTEQKLKIATLAPAQYSQEAYDKTSGIIDIALPSDVTRKLVNRTLTVISSTQGVLLKEDPIRILPEDPNLYSDEGIDCATRVRFYNFGKPVGAGHEVVMSPMLASDTAHQKATTDTQGWAKFPLPNTPGSVTGYVFQGLADQSAQPTLPVGNNFSPMTWTYMYHRILPADDDIANMDPTWANVHGHVLANWEAMAPCMDNWLLLGDEAQVKSYAKIIHKLTHPDNFEEFRYMPVTRDLTRGQRSLLYRFLGFEDVSNAGVARAAQQPREAPRPSDAPPTEVEKLSRSHRSG